MVNYQKVYILVYDINIKISDIMKKFKIINKENQKGYHLPTYGDAITIKSKYIKVIAVISCLSTFGTNWLIPIILKKIKDITIRYDIEEIKRKFVNLIEIIQLKLLSTKL